MIYGKTVGAAAYKVINIIDLPDDVQDELSACEASNDTGKIVNPKYYPKLRKWLKAHGHSDTDIYIGWWSW